MIPAPAPAPAESAGRCLLRCASAGARATLRHRDLLLGLFATHLLASGVLALLGQIALAPLLEGRPEPGLLVWSRLVLGGGSGPHLVGAVRAAAAVLALHALLGLLWRGALLERLAGGLARVGAVRHLPRLLALRLVFGSIIAALLAATLFAGHGLWPTMVEQLADDRAPAAVVALLGLLALVPLLLLWGWGAAAEPLAVAERSALGGLRRGLDLVRERPGVLVLLLLGRWLGFAAVTAAAGVTALEWAAAHLLLVALARVWLGVWGVAAVQALACDRR